MKMLKFEFFLKRTVIRNLENYYSIETRLKEADTTVLSINHGKVIVDCTSATATTWLCKIACYLGPML